MRTRLRRLTFLAGIALAVFGLTTMLHGQTAAQDKGVVVISGWGGNFQDAQRKAIFAPFEKETGIKVIEESNPPTMSRIKAMVESKNTEFDVGEVGPADFQALIKANLLEKLDQSIFDKALLNELDPRVPHPYGMGNVFYSQVIGYSTRKYSAANHPRSWADVWDVKKFPGRRVLFAPTWIMAPIEFALLADGVPADRLYPLDFKRAYESLTKIKPDVIKWATTGSMGPQALVDGEADIASVAHARIVQLKEQGAAVDFEWNQGLSTLDYWAIPKGAKNYKNAMKFIEFAVRAKPVADMCSLMPYGPVNKRSFEYMTPEKIRNSASHPENMKNQVVMNPEWWGQTDASGKTNVQKNLELWNAWILK